MQEQHLSEIEALYVKQYDKLLAYAIRLLKNGELAEEAVQETFRIACQKADVLHESVNKEGWLLITLKYVISNMEKIQRRANRFIVECLVLQKNAQENVDNIDIDILYKDIASSDEFLLIKEMVLDQKSLRELAEERGISIDACKKRVQRAKNLLRKWLENINDM